MGNHRPGRDGLDVGEEVAVVRLPKDVADSELVREVRGASAEGLHLRQCVGLVTDDGQQVKHEVGAYGPEEPPGAAVTVAGQRNMARRSTRTTADSMSCLIWLT